MVNVLIRLRVSIVLSVIIINPAMAFESLPELPTSGIHDEAGLFDADTEAELAGVA